MKNIKEGLDRKHLWEITRKYNSSHRRHRYELVEKPRKQVNITFVDAKLAIKVIKDCRTTVAHKFRTRLEFKQYNVILTKKKVSAHKNNEKTVHLKENSSFERENMQTHYKILSYSIDLYFHDYKLLIEINQNWHSDRNIDYKIKRQKL